MVAAVLACGLPTLASAQVGALQTDCAFGGVQRDGSYQFVATCAGRARSPDRRLAIVQKAYTAHQPPIAVQDATGRTFATLPGLSDDMPFSVHWAPGSRRFFVNHHVGSFLDVLRVFELAGRRVIERPAQVRAAIHIAKRRYPCLSGDDVFPNGVRWSRDGARIALVTISRPDACATTRARGWRPLWMIGDVRRGRIDPGSVRVQRDDRPLRLPRGGPYATLR